jgi:hypothetical protein
MYYCELGFSVGSCLDLFPCPSWYYGHLPRDRHSGYVMGGSKSWEAGRLSPLVI